MPQAFEKRSGRIEWMIYMQTQIDHNAYSALFSDSEEPEAGELSALLADPDHGGDKALSIRELQEPSEAGGEKRSRSDLPQPAW